MPNCSVRRECTLTKTQHNQAKQSLLDDVRDADIVNLTPSVIGSSIRILETASIRAMGALHVACALEWGAEIFASLKFSPTRQPFDNKTTVSKLWEERIEAQGAAIARVLCNSRANIIHCLDRQCFMAETL